MDVIENFARSFRLLDDTESSYADRLLLAKDLVNRLGKSMDVVMAYYDNFQDDRSALVLAEKNTDTIEEANQRMGWLRTVAYVLSQFAPSSAAVQEMRRRCHLMIAFSCLLKTREQDHATVAELGQLCTEERAIRKPNPASGIMKDVIELPGEVVARASAFNNSFRGIRSRRLPVGSYILSSLVMA